MDWGVFQGWLVMRKRAVPQTRAVPYPTPKSDGSRRMMLGVIKGLGKLPANDDEIEDRVLACALVAWGELAAMQDAQRRDEIVGSLGDLGKRVVGKLIAVAGEFDFRADSKGQSLVEFLYDAVADGKAVQVPLPVRPKSRR